jgi:hypothetical protein
MDIIDEPPATAPIIVVTLIQYCVVAVNPVIVYEVRPEPAGVTLALATVAGADVVPYSTL